jgi:hypothetical protein
LTRIVAALEAAGALLEAVRHAQRNHYPKTVKRGPYRQPNDSDTIDFCEACGDVWPCAVANTDESADKLWKLLDPDGHREAELRAAYLDYLHEYPDAERYRRSEGEQPLEFMTRVLTAAGKMPAIMGETST